jgi:hypothetical protein
MATETSNQIIQRHYGLKHPVADEEVIHELVNLRRKAKKGNLDDTQERLAIELDSKGMLFSGKTNHLQEYLKNA